MRENELGCAFEGHHGNLCVLEDPPVVLSSHWAFLCDPSLSRTASASFGTCPTRFTGRSRKQSATRRRLPASPTVPGHTLPAASGPRKAKVRLASCSPARSCRTGRGRCLWLCVWNACWAVLESAQSGMSPVPWASRWCWWWWWSQDQ